MNVLKIGARCWRCAHRFVTLIEKGTPPDGTGTMVGTLARAGERSWMFFRRRCPQCEAENTLAVPEEAYEQGGEAESAMLI